MIKVELTVREALNMVVSSRYGSEIFEKIVAALEVALGENQRRMVTITGGMSINNRIPCIKVIRTHTGWGLKEAKDWTDVLIGHYDSKYGYHNEGRKNTMTLKTSEAAENLLRDLVSLGCEGFLS